MIRNMTIYRKLFIYYTVIILTIIVIFEVFTFTSATGQASEESIKQNQQLGEEVAVNIKKISDTTDLILYRLFQSDGELSDTILYLENSITYYYQQKLKKFSETSVYQYRGMDDFARESFNLNNQMKSISFISYDQKRMITFQSNGDSRTSLLEDVKIESLKSKYSLQDGDIAFAKEIQNPISRENIGLMLVTYDGEFFQKSYEKNTKSQLLVFYGDTIIYDSKRKNTIEHLLNENDVLVSHQEMEDSLKANVSFYAMNEINVIRYIPKAISSQISPFLVFSLIALGGGIFFIGEFFVHQRLKHLTKRLSTLLEGMERVRGGDINATVEIKNENDEYNVIAEYFNQMCADLNRYIQKSYVAEIDQKNAELSALQSQINPHFLYNTLESIRMKAVCNGDKEVGKMLYALATIFRSQVKESEIITVAKELYYCKKYLEMFEFRYQNKFTFDIICPYENMGVRINKFIIQPIIENYFVHGIRLRDSDNFLQITVESKEDVIVIIVEDNGRGIPEEEIEAINQRLMENSSFGESIGVSNVHRRITAMYGKEYGVHLEKNHPRGLKVFIRFPKEVQECIK